MKLGSRLAPVLIALSLVACSKARTIRETAVGQCTACHGGTDNASGAPPKDLHGGTSTALPSVGAHSAHVGAGIDCGACHVKPATLSSPGHMDGRVTLTWGALATANGALSPSFDEATGTCTNVYCHGSFTGGQAANAPSWIRVGEGGAACGTCHGLPPPAPHPRNTSCGSCHSGYTISSVNLETHVNGMPDVVGLTCATCHGDSTRAATALNPQLAAAPPLDTRGRSSPTAPGVGAHQAHLTDGALRSALACVDCHDVPTTTLHASGTTTFHWSALATAGGTTVPAYQGGTCSGIYCHGATLGAGGSNTSPSWTGGGAEAACGACHGAPPPAPHPPNPNCGSCHPGYEVSSVNLATHVDGALQLVALTCTTCHGDPGRDPTPLNPQLPAAPPLDAHGDAASVHVGAHQAHLAGSAVSKALACEQCHTVPQSLSAHPTGTLELSWGPLATGAITATISENPAFAGFSTTVPSYAGGACSSTYCHGSYSGTFTYNVAGTDPPVQNTVSYAGSAAAPAWSGTASCGTCHGIPPTGGGVWHSGSHGGGNDCSLCHPDASGTGTSAAITDPTLHVDGKVDLAPRFVSACFHCH